MFKSESDIYLNLDQADGEEIWIEIMDDNNVELLSQNLENSDEDIKIEHFSDNEDNLEEIEDKQIKDEQIEDEQIEDEQIQITEEVTANKSIKGQKRVCNACGVAFKYLDRHLETHGPNNCIDCLLHFSERHLYDEHMQTYHNRNKESNKCKICDLGFSSLTMLAIHNYKHTNNYRCPLCNFTVKGKYKHSLINHIRRHEGQFSVCCEICGQGFLEKHVLASHMEIHEAIPKYTCEICQKKFTVKRYLDVHKNLNHKKELYGIEESFQCEICGRSFTFEKSLVRHLSCIHKIGEDRTVECPVCKKRIANNHNLKKHMRVHTGEKRFCCDLCGKAFSEKKYLQKHQAGHERQKERKRKLQKELENKFKREGMSSNNDKYLQEYFVYQDTDDDNPKEAIDTKTLHFPYDYC